MSRLHAGACIVTFLALGGCAMFSPHVTHKQIEKAPKGNAKDAAALDIDGGSQPQALKYAKQARDAYDRKRAQIQGTESGALATFIPLAAYVGYGAARGHASKDLARVATGGLAGMTLSQLLVQHDRVKVYTEASTRISCAIGVYRTARTASVLAHAAKDSLLAQTDLIRTELDLVPLQWPSVKNDDLVSATGVAATARLTAVEKSIQAKTDTQALDDSLLNKVSEIIGAADRELDATSPPIAASLPYVKAFSGYAIPAIPKAGTVAAPVTTFNSSINKFGATAWSDGFRLRPLPNTDKSDALKRYAELNDQIDALAGSLSQITALASAANYSGCTYVVTNAAFAAPVFPLQLGPGDSDHKSTKQVVAGQAITFTVSGGTPPYSLGIPGKDTAKITVEQEAVGNTMVFKIGTDVTTPKVEYVATLVDSVNNSKSLTMKVN